MRTMLIDCDVASTLAKVDRIDILDKAFPDARFFITNSVYVELLRAKQAGYSFPDKVLENLPVISMDADDLKAFQDISKDSSVHYGEAEGLSICREKDAIFLTNDRRAIRFAEKYRIRALDMKDLLTLLAFKRILRYEEMKTLIRDIEARDNTCIRDKDLILARCKEKEI
jgi:predicted nucleic acid-binding protein